MISPFSTQSRSRILTAAVVALVSVAAPAAAAAKARGATTLQPSGVGHALSCDPPAGDPYTHRCYPQAWGWAGSLGVSMLTGSGAGPTPYDLRAAATLTNTAVHRVSRASSSITYTWTFAASLDNYVRIDRRQGSASGYTALTLGATHASCSSCSVTTRKVLLGTDPATGESGPAQLNGGTVQLSVTLRNAAGGSVPAGDVTIRADLTARSSWLATPVYEGYSNIRTELRHSSLTAS